MIYMEYKDQANRLTVALPELPETAYNEVKDRVSNHFHLNQYKDGQQSHMLDHTAFDRDNQKVSIDWDIWSGFIVTAVDQQAEYLVQQIGHYLRDCFTH